MPVTDVIDAASAPFPKAYSRAKVERGHAGSLDGF
jgi:hypothetical protein